MRHSHTWLLAALAALTLAACERASDEAPNFSAPRAVSRTDAPPAVPAAEAPIATATATPAPALPGPDALSDAAITARVKASLANDPALAGADVSVNTDHGVVNLNGSVKTQEQAAVASSHAQRQDGVMRIDNHLAVEAR